MIRLLAMMLAALCLFVSASHASIRGQQTDTKLAPRFARPASGLELERRAQAGAFYAVLGRKSAALGYEHGTLEVWTWPLQILDRFALSFKLEGYPHEFRGADTLSLINVRPEATTFTYTHAAFTVRQHIFAPHTEPGIIMLLDVDSTLPLKVNVTFRPRLRLTWPAGVSTGNYRWDEDERAFMITEDAGRYVGIVGSPAASDAVEMPHQEEPRDLPVGFSLAVSSERLRGNYIPIVIAGGIRGREDTRAAYRRLLERAEGLYIETAEHYRRLLEETTTITTPDARLDEAYRWAKVGVDKGVVENPLLGTGLVAGFRTSGESERPGFAWYFGRDALWTSFALNSYGDFRTTRAALDFLKKYQRADGKIPHEISQSATLIRWFEDYAYPWASADSTPLFIVAHAELLRATGDIEYTRANRDSIIRAYRFAAATDTDEDGLIENTAFGHGWVEGGALYPPHEEIYMQGIWVEALRGISEMADALGDAKLAAETSAAAERTRLAVEQTYWLNERGFYAFATNLLREQPRRAEPGPNRAVRQERMNQLDRATLIDEETVMPAVALWWRVLDERRAQRQIDALGSARIATDWGARIISDESLLYDPLSYHHGSVWPLFTGWSSLGAYRYGRPHVGFQALTANIMLNRQNALGFVTELLSGEFNAPFGRSSHHQVWSEAMVIAPLVRGLLGLEADERGRRLSFAPQLPADWKRLDIRHARAGDSRFRISLERGAGRMLIRITRHDENGQGDEKPRRQVAKIYHLSPAFALDAEIRGVTVNGRDAPFELSESGDVQFASIEFENSAIQNEVVFTYTEGSEVYITREAPRPGDRSTGLRILRARAEEDGLRLLLEGEGGHAYTIGLITQRNVGDAPGINATRRPGEDTRLSFVLNAPGRRVRRELFIPLSESNQ